MFTPFQQLFLMAIFTVCVLPVPVRGQLYFSDHGLADGGVAVGIFRNGFAPIQEQGALFYINSEGWKFTVHNPNNVAWNEDYGIQEYMREMGDLKSIPDALPRHVVIIESERKQGVLTPTGEVLVPVAYDRVDFKHSLFWELEKDGLKSLYLADGTILPFFESIGYLDGEYFDVRQNGSWHLYSKSADKIVTAELYEGFDYCGGCSIPSPYVYAKKNGKWGIIDWDETVLVPFEFDHEHRSMRSDQWVQSFSQDGASMVVHIPTQQVFPAHNWVTKLVASTLITKENGHYGAYNREGMLILPFDEYDLIEAPNSNHYLGYYGSSLMVSKAGKRGVARVSDGELVVPLDRWEQVMVYDDYFAVTKDGETRLLEAGKSETLTAVEHGDITHIKEYFYSSGSDGVGVFKIKKRAFYGLYFAESGLIYEPQFYRVRLLDHAFFEGGKGIVAERQGLKTLFDLQGNQLLPFQVEEFETWKNAGRPLLSVRIDGKWGLYDPAQASYLIPPLYDRYFTTMNFSKATFIRATLEERGLMSRYVLYDLCGKQVTSQEFTTAYPVDSTYCLLVMARNQKLDNYSMTLNDYAVFNSEIGEITSLDYYFVSITEAPGLLVVSDDGIKGRLYHIGDQKELRRLYWIYLFSGIVADQELVLQRDNRNVWGLSHFHNGLFRIETKDGVGFMDVGEQVVIKPHYEQADMITAEIAVVADPPDRFSYYGRSYLVNSEGNRIFPEDYMIEGHVPGYGLDPDLGDIIILTRQMEYNSYYGLGDLNTGEVILEAVYNELTPLGQSDYLVFSQLVSVEIDGDSTSVTRLGLVDKRGKILFEPQFDDIRLERTFGRTTTGVDADRRNEEVFPLLVKNEGTWRYIRQDGTFLPIVGDRTL